MRETREACWTRLIAEQEAGAESVRAFCHRHGIGEAGFYWWRRRLRGSRDVRFALVRTRPALPHSGESALELVFTNGERLRIGRGADAVTLRVALDAIRA